MGSVGVSLYVAFPLYVVPRESVGTLFLIIFISRQSQQLLLLPASSYFHSLILGELIYLSMMYDMYVNVSVSVVGRAA